MSSRLFPYPPARQPFHTPAYRIPHTPFVSRARPSQGFLRLWRASIGALSLAAKQAVAAVACSKTETSLSASSSLGHSGSGDGGNEGRRGESSGGGGGGASTTITAGGGAGADGADGDACGRSPETVVTAAEAMLWAAVDQAGSCHVSAWLLLVALLPLVFSLW